MVTAFKKYFQLVNKLLFKYGTIYREVMHTPRIDVCKVNKLGTDNKLVKMIYAFVNSTDLTHECPYNVNQLNPKELFFA